MRMDKEKFYTTLDAYQAGFLTLRGHQPHLSDQNGKVIFVFNVSSLFLKDLAAYHDGASIEAFRFASAIKTLKSQIHSMRKNKDNYYGLEEKIK
jgi:hypothetical protein